jgi:hypothetical protein
MNNYEQILRNIHVDERYQRNLDWGIPRKGHPEGTIRQHIRDLENNLNAMRARLSELDHWKLKVLIHTHDTFKADSKQGVKTTDSRSHASLAREFLAEFCDDQDLLAMVQYHDEPYALWKQHESRGKCDPNRFDNLIHAISDWDLFLVFLIIDGCTKGKSREPLTWFIVLMQDKGVSSITLEWLL